MTNIETWILSYLLNSLWQVPLLFAAGWLAARALRPLGAAAEHRVWVSVLLAANAPPRRLNPAARAIQSALRPIQPRSSRSSPGRIPPPTPRSPSSSAPALD